MLVCFVTRKDQWPTQVASSGLPFIDWLRVPRTASKKRALLLLYFEENTNASFSIPFIFSQLQMPGGYRLNFLHSTRTPDGYKDGEHGGGDCAGDPDVGGVTMAINSTQWELHSMQCADYTDLTRFLENDALPESRVGRFRWFC
jgi:hypothetical protein